MQIIEKLNLITGNHSKLLEEMEIEELCCSF